MPFTKKQLSELKKAYASGVLRLQYGDQSIIFKSEVEMRAAIEKMEKEIKNSSSAKLVKLNFKGLR